MTKVPGTHGSSGNKEQKDHSRPNLSVATHFSPIHGLFQTATARLKTKGLLVQTIRLVHQKLNFLPTLQDLSRQQKTFSLNKEFGQKNPRIPHPYVPFQYSAP